MKKILSGKDLPGKLVYLFSVFISLGMILEVFAGLDEGQLYIYFNSDTLYLPSIFRDLFVDHSGFRGWHLNGAPNFFPDMAFYFIINGLFQDFRTAMVVFSIVQYLALILLVRWLFRTVSHGISEEALATANLAMMVIFLVSFYPGDFVFTFYLLSISYHLGAFLMAIVSLVLTFRFLKTGRYNNMAWLFAAGLAGVANDKLYVAMYVLPLISLSLFLFSTALRKKILLIFANVAAVTLLGTLIYNGIKDSGYIHIISLSWKFMNFANIPASFDTMINQHLTYFRSHDFRSLTILLSLLSVMATSYFAVRLMIRFFRDKQLPEREIFPAMYLVFATAFWIIVLATPVINGSYVGYAILRYNIYAFYLSLFNFGVLCHIAGKEFRHKLPRRLLTALPVMLLILTVMPGLRPLLKNGLKKVTHYYPAIVREMDNLAVRETLRYGLATYWHAKYMTMFSQTGLRIYTVYKDLTPWYHVTNENWYHRGGKGTYGNPAFTFIYMDGIDTELIKEKLGAPLQTIPVGENYVSIYPPFYFNEKKQPVFYNQD